MTSEAQTTEAVEYDICDCCADSDDTVQEHGNNAEMLCQDCRDCYYSKAADGNVYPSDETFMCDHCGDIYHDTDIRAGMDNVYCHECAMGGDIVWCDDTETYEHCEQAFYCEYSDQWYYNEENRRGIGPVLPYDYNVFNETGRVCYVNGNRRNLTSTVRDLVMGVELETDAREGNYDADIAETLMTDTDFDRYGICKSDGTVSGPELVTVPADLQSHRETFDWSEWCETLRPMAKGHYADAAGMHVHINRAAVSPLVQGKLLVFLNSYASNDFVTMVAQREETTYCEKRGGWNKVGMAGKFERTDKFVAAHVTHRGTIEIRIFRASLLPERILKNLEFCDALVRWCRVESVKGLTVANCIRFISEHRKDYPELYKFITNRSES